MYKDHKQKKQKLQNPPEQENLRKRNQVSSGLEVLWGTFSKAVMTRKKRRIQRKKKSHNRQPKKKNLFSKRIKLLLVSHTFLPHLDLVTIDQCLSQNSDPNVNQDQQQLFGNHQLELQICKDQHQLKYKFNRIAQLKGKQKQLVK